MKKLYTFRRILSAAVLFMMSAFVWAYDFKVGGIYYNITSDSTVEVTYAGPNYNSVKSYDGYVFVPSTVNYEKNTYSVISIGDYAFFQCYDLISITMPNSIISIGEHAFMTCNKLMEITIPDSITSIGDYAFESCRALTGIVIPKGIVSIGKNVFQGCSGLKEVIIQDGVETIGEGEFWSCSNITSITIPNSVKYIGVGAFSHCSSLEEIIVAPSNTHYDSREDCNAIIESSSNTLIAGCQNTVIPNSVTSIGDNAFLGCQYITEIVMPNSITSIGSFAFPYCWSLTEITIPNSVTTIGNRAFEGLTIENLTCLATTPPTCELADYGYGVFSGINKQKCTLHVPKGCVEVYRSADQWKDFYNIVDDAIETTAIETINMGKQDEEAIFYTIDGKLVDNPTKKGIYIRNGKKVVIK